MINETVGFVSLLHEHVTSVTVSALHIVSIQWYFYSFIQLVCLPLFKETLDQNILVILDWLL